MKVVRGLKGIEKAAKGSVVTIGVFDGLHIGHREIIEMVVRRAKKLNLKSVALTFDPHPLKVLHLSSWIPSLLSLNHRIKLIDQLGIDLLVVVNFTKTISNLSPEEFVKEILISKIGAKEIYVGENFYFGKGAKAGVKTLGSLARRFGFRMKIVKPITIGKDIVSSSLIRKLITNGDIAKASKFLDRPVSILGTVISGSRLARVLGYPTANINPHHEAIPPSGVYAVLVRLKNRLFKGVLNIGRRPTFYGPRDKEPTIEVHIFDFDERIYDKEIEILFIKKLRDEAKFKDRDALVNQIRKDEALARAILRNYV